MSRLKSEWIIFWRNRFTFQYSNHTCKHSREARERISVFPSTDLPPIAYYTVLFSCVCVCVYMFKLDIRSFRAGVKIVSHTAKLDQIRWLMRWKITLMWIQIHGFPSLPYCCAVGSTFTISLHSMVETSELAEALERKLLSRSEDRSQTR